MTHRKIVQYVTDEGDDRDMPSGHGSHVVGSIAGNIVSTQENVAALSPYNGMGYDAKISFYDLSKVSTITDPLTMLAPLTSQDPTFAASLSLTFSPRYFSYSRPLPFPLLPLTTFVNLFLCI